MKRLLIIGDSLTFARPKHGILLEDSWPFILEEKGYRVVHRGRGGATSRHIGNELNSLYNYWGKPDEKPFFASVLQVGIVDCTPRLLSKRNLFILNKFPGGGRLIQRLNRSRFLVERFGKPWVSSTDYERLLVKIKKMIDDISLNCVAIEILPPSGFLIENAGNFSAAVDEYNSHLREAFPNKTVSLEGADFCLPDGHHLNHRGHRVVASKVDHLLRSF